MVVAIGGVAIPTNEEPAGSDLGGPLTHVTQPDVIAQVDPRVPVALSCHHRLIEHLPSIRVHHPVDLQNLGVPTSHRQGDREVVRIPGAPRSQAGLGQRRVHVGMHRPGRRRMSQQRRHEEARIQTSGQRRAEGLPLDHELIHRSVKDPQIGLDHLRPVDLGRWPRTWSAPLMQDGIIGDGPPVRGGPGRQTMHITVGQLVRPELPATQPSTQEISGHLSHAPPGTDDGPQARSDDQPRPRCVFHPGEEEPGTDGHRGRGRHGAVRTLHDRGPWSRRVRTRIGTMAQSAHDAPDVHRFPPGVSLCPPAPGAKLRCAVPPVHQVVRGHADEPSLGAGPIRPWP